MERLRPLSESDCYVRLYGQREPTVTVVSRRPRVQPWPAVTGEELREAFGERLEGREAIGAMDSEAA
jgi:hypothetical protein